MSLENIQLPAFILRDLFKNCLVDLNSDEPNKAMLMDKTLHFLGSNLKRIVILINNPEASFLADDELQFLTGILSACKLTLADIALINLYKTPAINYTLLNEELSPAIVLMFGVPPASIELPFQVPAFQVQAFNGQLYLQANALHELQANVELKKLLWSKLQQLFIR